MKERKLFSLKPVRFGKRRQIVFVLLLTLFGFSNVWAQYSSNGWSFTVKGDGTATLYYPIYEVWEYTDSLWYDGSYHSGMKFVRYDRKVVNSLSMPESVTAQTIAWDNDNKSYQTSLGATYTVTEISNGLNDEQRSILTSVSIPNTVTTIAPSAFSDCKYLSSVTIPASVTTMSYYVFQNCTSLQSATVLSSMIGGYQFANCTALKEVTLSENLTTIMNQAFNNCQSLETLTVPASVITLGNGAFAGLTGLKTLNYHAKEVQANNYGGFGGTPIENLDLTGVETIPGGAFQNCTKLKNLVLSESLKSIGGFAFENDSALLSVTIPASVTSIGTGVFRNCTSLQSVTILNSTIGVSQFTNCTALKEVMMSNNVTTIMNLAFDNCPSVETLTVPASVTSIRTGLGASFSGLTGLKTLNYHPKTVLSALFISFPIENVDLTGVEIIEGGSFRDCTALRNITLSNSLKSIEGNAFENCASLMQITIPSSVTYINETAFGAWNSGLTGLKTVNYHAKTVPRTLFRGFSIENIDLTGVEIIEGDAFCDCTALRNVTLSNSLKSIDRLAFENCASLMQITIPSSVTYINGGAYGAFKNCTNLQEVTVRWATPLPLGASQGESPFYGVNTGNIRLNVPDGTEADYKQANVWKGFYIETGGIDHYAPHTLGFTGNTSINIYGGRLTAAATVELIQNSNRFAAVAVEESGPSQCVAGFEFDAIQTGLYDLHIQQPGGIDTLIVNAVTVHDIIYPKVVPKLLTGLNLRTALTFSANLTLQNMGNIDALGVSAYIVAPEEVSLSHGLERYGNLIDVAQNFDFYCEEFGQTFSVPNSQIKELVMDYKLLDLALWGMPVDTLFGKPYKGKVYQFYVPKIPAGSAVSFYVDLRSPSTNLYSKIYAGVETPNFFNPSFPEDSIPEGIVDRLSNVLDYYIAATDPEVLQNMNDTTAWVRTLKIADDIMRKILADDRDYVGYSSKPRTESIFGTLHDLTYLGRYDNGLLWKQAATLMLALETIADSHSTDRRADGILDFTASAPSSGIGLRAAAQGTPEQRIQWVVNWGNNRFQGTQNGNYQPTWWERAFNWVVGKAPLDGGAASQGLDVAAAGIHVFSNYSNRLGEIMDGNGWDDAVSANISVRNSYDPNDITGPAGVDEQRYIPATEDMNYLVRFENMAEAGLPAMFINVYDTLDVNKYDLSTFEFGDIQIGDTTLAVPRFKQSYYREYDMRPKADYVVSIAADLNTENGAIHWRFETLDAATLTTVTDPEAGFLPPNVNAPEGEGSVSFSVRLKEGLAQNTVVANKADIVFDFNEPITTNLWENTIDKTPPTSSVSVVQTDKTEVTVRLSGTDSGSGVRYYKLYAKINDSDFFALGNYFSNEVIFNAMPDTLYSFYVEAVDYVGNAEQKTASAEASIRISKPMSAIDVAATVGGSVATDKTSAIFEETVTLTVAPDAGYALDEIRVYKTGDETILVEPLDETSPLIYEFTMPAYDVTVAAVFKKTQALSDREAVEAAKAIIEGMSSPAVAQATANDEASVKTWLAARINALAGMAATGIAVTADDITLTGFAAAVAGNATTPAGTNGSFAFTVALTQGASTLTTTAKAGVVTATPYATSSPTDPTDPSPTDPTDPSDPPVGNEQLTTNNEQLKAYVENGVLYVSGVALGAEWRVYNVMGTLIYYGIASDVETQCIASLPSRGVYIVTDGKATVKVVY